MVELFGVRRGKTEPLGGAGDSRGEAALEMTLKIYHQVKIACADSSQKWKKLYRSMRAIVQNYFVQPRMVIEHRLRLGFHRPRDVRFGPRLANAPEQRQRANDVANRAEQHDQNATRRRNWRGDGFSRGHFAIGRGGFSSNAR